MSPAQYRVPGRYKMSISIAGGSILPRIGAVPQEFNTTNRANMHIITILLNFINTSQIGTNQGKIG